MIMATYRPIKKNVLSGRHCLSLGFLTLKICGPFPEALKSDGRNRAVHNACYSFGGFTLSATSITLKWYPTLPRPKSGHQWSISELQVQNQWLQDQNQILTSQVLAKKCFSIHFPMWKFTYMHVLSRGFQYFQKFNHQFEAMSQESEKLYMNFIPIISLQGIHPKKPQVYFPQRCVVFILIIELFIISRE